MKDPQRNRLYKWEGEWRDWNTTTMPLARVRSYVHWACKLYHIKPPSVVRHFTKELSFSQDNVISVQAGQENAGLALHEAAHFICDKIFGHGIAHHSPQFMAIYFWLLIRARIAPRIAILASAKSNRLHWLPLWQVSPKRLASRGRIKITKQRLKPPAR